MVGWRCRTASEPPRRAPFPEPTPPGLNHLVVTGTLAAALRTGWSPRGEPVTFLRLALSRFGTLIDRRISGHGRAAR